MKKCKRLFAGILTLTVLISCFAGCNQETQTVDLKNIQLTDAQIQEVSDNTDAELTEGNFSGTAYTGLNNQDIFLKSYGYTDKKKSKAIDNDYVYQLGSVSKIFTGLAVMKLNSDGKLELSDTLDKFFPKYKKKEYKEITIANLLDMTAGFGSYTSYLSEGSSFEKRIGKMVSDNPNNPKISDKVLDYILAKGPENPVGDYCYSHSCYYILGKVIEKIT
ncbi:MAG: serine hydrolase domain-containing protein, partial [Ruminococcus sp.]